MSKTRYTAALRRLLTLTGLSLAFAAPAHAESLLGTYAAAQNDGLMTYKSGRSVIIAEEVQKARIIVRFEQKGGAYPLAGRLISASSGVYTGRGSGTMLWEVRNTGRTCGLYNNDLRLTIYEGTIFNETSGTSALGHIYAGNTPTGFTFIPGRPNGPASEVNQQIADSCAVDTDKMRFFRKTG